MRCLLADARHRGFRGGCSSWQPLLAVNRDRSECAGQGSYDVTGLRLTLEPAVEGGVGCEGLCALLRCVSYA